MSCRDKVCQTGSREDARQGAVEPRTKPRARRAMIGGTATPIALFRVPHRGVLAMAEVTRKQVEERACRIWQDAGCPEGSSLAHWLQAEIELGVIPKAGPDDPLV